MRSNLLKPILYLITRGATTETTTPEAVEFQEILTQVSAAVTAGISLIQIREKKLTSRVLFELTLRVAMITRGSPTRVLVNDRADIAAGAVADGVHLTTRSLGADVIRKTFGDQFLIGSSTHSLAEARAAKEGGANFVVFGPIFDSSS
jgi:thiamine-phosphate pyrophosphorylase